MHNVDHLIDRNLVSRNSADGNFRLQAPLLLNHFPYVREFPKVNQMLDTVLACDRTYRRPTKGGADLAEFEVILSKPVAIVLLG